MEHSDRIELLLKKVDAHLRSEPCTKDKDLLLEIERVRGEMRAFKEHQKVSDGMTNGQFTRLHERLDKLQAENIALREAMTKKDSEHSGEINKINMHLKYSLGAFATLLFLVNFFEKIRSFVGVLMGNKP